WGDWHFTHGELAAFQGDDRYHAGIKLERMETKHRWPWHGKERRPAIHPGTLAASRSRDCRRRGRFRTYRPSRNARRWARPRSARPDNRDHANTSRGDGRVAWRRVG